MTDLARPSIATGDTRRWRSPDLTRDVDAGAYLETMLVAAVASVLLTRLYLQATGFPQIGSGGVHVAHLLWGGLLMLASLVVLLATLGKRVKHVSAAIGGLGFGLFVDEIGKFVTSDNNYFFQPAVSLIYVIMVLLFLLFRAINRRDPSPMELLVNATDNVREVVLDGATRAEVARGLDLLRRSGAVGPLAEHIRVLLESTECELDAGPSRIRRLTDWAMGRYERLLAWTWFRRAVLLVFVGQATLGLLAAVSVGELLRRSWIQGNPAPMESVAVASVATSLVSLLLVMVGVMYLPHQRAIAYHWFERSLLVAILITQVMLFWQSQFAALGGLFINLALLIVVRSMSTLERARALPTRL
jgi:hypothetical protein